MTCLCNFFRKLALTYGGWEGSGFVSFHFSELRKGFQIQIEEGVMREQSEYRTVQEEISGWMLEIESPTGKNIWNSENFVKSGRPP